MTGQIGIVKNSDTERAGNVPLEQALLGLFRQKAERMPKDGLKIKSVKNSDTGQFEGCE